MGSKLVTKPVLVVVGPTAIGKTGLSLELAHKLNAEIVSIDSMQVYRYMDIGTAKVSIAEQADVPHHLIDIVNPDESYDASQFVTDAMAAIEDIHNRNRLPLLTGGTGLYLRSLFEGIFPGVPSDEKIRGKLQIRLEIDGADKLHEELSSIDRISAERIHKNDTHRLLRALEVYYASGKPWSEHLQSHKEMVKPVVFQNVLRLGLTCDREKLYKRINLRCEMMIDQGLEEEVKQLLSMGYDNKLKPFGAIGYKHMINYLSGEWSRQEMMELLARDTRRYAKRQYTWFSKISDLHWLEVEDRKSIFEELDNWAASH